MTMDQLTKMGKPPSDLGPMLDGGWPSLQPTCRARLVRCEARTRVADCSASARHGPKGPTLEFAAFMIHWDDGAWRIGWVAQSSGPATRSSGDKRSADELLGDPRLALE